MVNFQKLTNHSYVVKNQNGFNKALYRYFGEDGQSTTVDGMGRDAIKKLVDNYPKSYPAVVVFSDRLRECGVFNIEVINLTELSPFYDLLALKNNFKK